MIEVYLQPHDVSWGGRFLAEADRIGAAMWTWIDIEHIGSTSVPGLTAKPVIDILVGCPDSDVHAELIEVLQLRLGYQLDGDRRYHTWLSWPRGGPAQYVVHSAAYDADVWKARIGFRDALRTSPDLCAEYEQLKRELAAAHACDVTAYTAAKRSFVERVLLERGLEPERTG